MELQFAGFQTGERGDGPGKACGQGSFPEGRGSGRGEGAMEQAEACYRLDEALDEFEEKLREPVSRVNGGIGEFCWSGDPDHTGFKLSYEEQLVHLAGF